MTEDGTPSPISSNTRRDIGFGLLMAIFIVALDQWLKILVEANLPFGQPVEILPVFSLLYTFNTGVAFSFMNNLSPLVLLAIACVVVLIMVVLWWQARHEGLISSLGFGMIFGGAIGNIIDRAAYGHVIDYVYLHAGQYSFAIFNLADAALTVGVIAILVSSFFVSSRASDDD